MAPTRRKLRTGGVAKVVVARSCSSSSSTFGTADYHSGNGMLTDVWGPAQWHVMHTMSFNYPVNPTTEQRQWYRAHFLGLRHVLPCGKCRENLAKNFTKLPLRAAHMKNRDTFSRYVYDLHELVNGMLGKKSGLSYVAVRDRYENFRARCGNITVTAVPAAGTASGEKGCTEPLIGVKQRCLIRIVPKITEGDTLTVDAACHATKHA